MIAKFTVHYRTIPAALDRAICADASISHVKEGVKRSLGHDCPRMTITMVTSQDAQADKKRIAAFVALLSELQTNNQIVSFSHVSKKS